MIVLIYRMDTGRVVEEHRGELSDIRPRLHELRDANPDHAYIMIGRETRKEALKKCEASREEHLRRQAAIAALPPIKGGDLNHEQWAAAMALLDERQRYQAANLAAHSHAIVRAPNGVIIVGHRGEATLLQAGKPPEAIKAPKICQSCRFSKTHIASQRGKLVCSIGHLTGAGLRIVEPANTCSGWEKF